MARSLTLAAAITCFLSLAACDSANSSQADSKTLIPYEVGVKWTFKAVAFRGYSYPPSEYVDEADATDRNRKVTFEVARDTVVAGERWFTLQMDTLRVSGFHENKHPLLMTHVPGTAKAYWYTNRDDGVYRMFSGEAPQLIYSAGKSPVEDARDGMDEIIVLVDASETYDLQSGVVSVREYKRVPQRYRWKGQSGDVGKVVPLNDYIAPGQGIVAVETISYFQAGYDREGKWYPATVNRWQLVSYEKP